MERFFILGEIRKITGRFWGFTYVKPKTEKKVWEALKSRGVVCYLPLVPKARMHHYTKIVTQVPMLASYVFLCVDDEERREIKKDVKEIVQIELLREPGAEEQFIGDLNVLKQCEELAKDRPVLVKPEIVAGDDVLVIAGPLKGQQVKVLRRDDHTESIVINLTLLNTHIEYPISAGDLKKLI